MYIIYKILTGKILASSNNPNQTLDISEELLESAEIDDLFSNYVENGVIKKIPPNPYKYGKFDYSTKNWVIDTEAATTEVLNKRNQLLTESDWISYRAYETNTPIPQVWLDYRQALRDITLQVGYPLDVVWPTPPGA